MDQQDKIELFWHEVRLIRKQHLHMFPLDEMDNIQLQDKNGKTTLDWGDKSALDPEIKSQIEFIFKLIYKVSEEPGD